MKTSIAFVVALAACGGSGKKPDSTPTADPIPMNEDNGSQAANEPTPATQPAQPTEPAKPAEPDPAQVKAELLAAENAAFEKAKPVFDKWCAKCHSSKGDKAAPSKLEHFDMTTYPFGGHHAMELGKYIRKSLAIGGGKPTMPKDKKGAVKGDELALIAAWADAFDAAHAGGAHEGHGGHEHGGHEH